MTYQDAGDDFGNPATVIRTAILMGTIVAGGSLASDTIWTLAGSPYLLLGDVSVNSGITLTADAGVRVLFFAFSDDQSSGTWSNRSELIINNGGRLMAEGTSASPVVFTSSESPATAGDWGTVRFNEGSSGRLSNCEISGASYGIYAYRSSPMIEDCVISDNESFGIYAYYFESSPIISGNTITGNGTGIYGDYQSSPTISGNTISGNNGHGIEMYYPARR